MADNRLKAIEAARRQGIPLPAEAEAWLLRKVQSGEAPPELLSSQQRSQFDAGQQQQETQRQLQVEGGGLQEVEPITAPAMSVMEDLGREANPQRQTPGLAQVGAESVGGIGGAMAGTRYGGKLAGPWGALAGGALGAAVGTFMGGLTSGRGVQDAAIDALEQGALEATTAAAGKAATRMVRGKSMPADSRQALEEAGLTGIVAHGPQQTEYQAGNVLKQRLKGNFKEAYGEAGRQYDAVRQAVPEVSVGDIKREAKRLGVSLPSMDIQAGNVVSFDDAQVAKSELLRQARNWRSRGENIAGSKAERLAGILKGEMASEAERAGIGTQFKAADDFFAKRVAEPFYSDAVSEIVQHSGRQIVNELSGEKVSQSVIRAPIDDVKQVVKALGAEGSTLPQLQSAVVGSLIQKATDERGILQPARLQRTLHGIEPEKLDALLGPEVAAGLRDFADTYAHGLTRTGQAITFGGAGIAAASGGAALSGGAAALTGLETLNEANMLGRMIVNRPSVMQQLKEAVLMGDQGQLHALRIGRIGLTQLGGQAARQVLPGAPGTGTLGQLLGLRMPGQQ